MLYRNGKKYAIREYGTNGSEWANGDTIPKVDSLVIDSSFADIGNGYMQYAIKRWNTFFKDGIREKNPSPNKEEEKNQNGQHIIQQRKGRHNRSTLANPTIVNDSILPARYGEKTGD